MSERVEGGDVFAEVRGAFLNDTDEPWLRFAEVVSGWMPKYPRPGDQPRTVVRWASWFLRHSKGPRAGHFWDVYPDDYLSKWLALRALSEAPPPPPLGLLSHATAAHLAAAPAPPPKETAE